jgi:dethiobiotin synthetase
VGGVTDTDHTRARGLFVTATDTGVGKTVLSATLIAAIRAAGEPVRAHKPVVTGLEDFGLSPSSAAYADGPVPGCPPQVWPPDHELLAAAAKMTPEEVAPLRYPAAASPKLAAVLAGEHIDPAALLARARGPSQASLAEPAEITVVEGVGGLLVPFTDEFCVRDLAVALGFPMLIAARPGLGTINHTLLTLDAARAAGLRVRAVVLTPWPRAPEQLERSNREEIERLGDVEVAVLRRVRGPDLGELERAGRWLPWRRWLGDSPPRAPAGRPPARAAARH